MRNSLISLQRVYIQQAQSDQELSSLAVLAARRRLRLGDLEDDDDAERRSVQLQMAAPTPVVVNAPDNSLFVERIVRVEDKVSLTVCLVLMPVSSVELPVSLVVTTFGCSQLTPLFMRLTIDILCSDARRPCTRARTWSACGRSWTS